MLLGNGGSILLGSSVGCKMVAVVGEGSARGGEGGVSEEKKERRKKKRRRRAAKANRGKHGAPLFSLTFSPSLANPSASVLRLPSRGIQTDMSRLTLPHEGMGREGVERGEQRTGAGELDARMEKKFFSISMVIALSTATIHSRRRRERRRSLFARRALSEIFLLFPFFSLSCP